MTGIPLGFPAFVRVTHWFNLLFLTMLVRSGLSILSEHPKLYWDNGCRPGSEWLKFTKKVMPKDRLWTSADEVEDFSPWVALPGGANSLGLGRYWHFTNVFGWLTVAAVYLVGLFATDQWRRLVPTSWTLVPEAFQNLLTYLSFRLPPEGTTANPLAPYNALQQLTYFAVIFWLGPHMILTGLAMSPAIDNRFRWYPKLFFGRQPARSLHFLGMVAYLGFLVIHVFMVVVHGFAKEMTKMTLGEGHEGSATLGLAIGLGIVAAVVLIHAAATVASHLAKGATYALLSFLTDRPRRLLFHHIRPAATYPESEITPTFRINGYPPTEEYPKVSDAEYIRLKAGGFADWRLEVRGMVAESLSLSIDDVRALPRREQVTMHHCIQGWSAIGKWAGVSVSEVLNRCKPLPGARYVVFRSYQRHEQSGHYYYEVIDLETATQPQTILAYEFNNQPLPIEHGAPLRVRIENDLGFKMVKYLRSIELVDDYRKVGGGKGGVREDNQQFDMSAHI